MSLRPSDKTTPQRLFSYLPGLAVLSALIIVIGGLAFFLWLTGEVTRGETRNFDESIRNLVYQHAWPGLTVFMQLITTMGSATFLLILGFVITFAFLRAGWRRALIQFLITILGAVLLNAVLKSSFRRARPIPFFDTPLPSSFSFPSGHALLSFCFYGVLAALLTARIHNHRVRMLIWLATASLIGLIGFSRIYLGVHYPSDVIAGYTAAVIWVITVAFVDRMFRRQPAEEPSGTVRK